MAQKTKLVPLLFLLVAATAAPPPRTTALRPIHLEPREGRPHAFVTDQGREIIFHGTAAVVKGPPWYPEHTEVRSGDKERAACVCFVLLHESS